MNAAEVIKPFKHFFFVCGLVASNNKRKTSRFEHFKRFELEFLLFCRAKCDDRLMSISHFVWFFEQNMVKDSADFLDLF